MSAASYSHCKYTPLSNALIVQRFKGLISRFTCYVNDVGCYIKDASFVANYLYDVIIQVDKRAAYHCIFHDMPLGLSEPKALASYCYWILKLRPFSVVFRDKTDAEKTNAADKKLYDDALSYFTERFCLHMLDSLCWELKGGGLKLSDSREAELEYALKHTDISKGALMVIF